MCGHSDVLNVLLENGADLNTPDKHHAYPIHYAAQMMARKNKDDDSSSKKHNSVWIELFTNVVYLFDIFVFIIKVLILHILKRWLDFAN